MGWEASITDIAEARAKRVSVKWSSITGSRVLVRRWQDIRNDTEETAFRCLALFGCATNAIANTPSQFVLNPLADGKVYTGVWRQVSLEEGRRLTGVDVQGVFQVLVECVAAPWFGFYSDRDGFGDSYQNVYSGSPLPYSAPEDVVGTVYTSGWQHDPNTGLYAGTMAQRTSEPREFGFAAQAAAGVVERETGYRNRRGLFDAPASVQNRLYGVSWSLQSDRTYNGDLKDEVATPFAVAWSVPSVWGNIETAVYRHWPTVPNVELFRPGFDFDFAPEYNRFMSYDARWVRAPRAYRVGPVDAGAGSYQFTEAERSRAYLGWDTPPTTPASVQNRLFSDSWALDERTGLYSGRVTEAKAYPDLMTWTEPGPWGDAQRAVYRFWPAVPDVPRWALEADIQFAPTYNRFGSYDLQWGRTPAAYRQTLGPLQQADTFFESSAGLSYRGWDMPPVIAPAWARGAVYRANWDRDWRTGLYSGNIGADYGKPRAWSQSWATPWGTATASTYRDQTEPVAPLDDFRRWDSDARNDYGANGLYNSTFGAVPIPYDFDAGEFLRSRDAFAQAAVRPYMGRAARFDAPEGPVGTVYDVQWTMNTKTGTYDGALSRETSAPSTVGTLRTYGYDGWAFSYDYRAHTAAVVPDVTWMRPGYAYNADWQLNQDKTYTGGVNVAYEQPRFFSEYWPTRWGTARRGSYEAWPYDPAVGNVLPISDLGYNTSVVTRVRNGAYFVDWHAIPAPSRGGGGGDDWANWTGDPFTVYERKFFWRGGQLLYGDMEITKTVKQTTSPTQAFGFVNFGLHGSGVHHVGGSKYRATKVTAIVNPTTWHVAYPAPS